ncbi:hypothetical protein Ndes2526B_g04244 [Nannochloris sp. 'desiccata']|nr:hypothetical protein KSW81_000985 [Chlorella desiccata (nom. nud.)]KAH7620326.1 hypothetical protein NADE_002952 [Chlorella desiccata (nom. nud.)]
MEAAAVESFEERAISAEQRLDALESKLANGTPSSSGMDVQRYIAELQALRTVLLAAQAEQEAQSANMAELETSNSKLAYQVKHLKRSLQEADEKLKAAGVAN